MSEDVSELESLISEYDETAGAPEPTPNAEIGKLTKAIQPVVDYVNADRAEKQQKQIKADVKDITGFFSEAEELKDIPDELKRGFIEAHAQDNADFGKAFDNKAENPKAWEAARETARDKFTELVSKLPGSTVRTDVEAAKAAVDGTTETIPSGEGPSPVQKMRMGPKEWRDYKEEQERQAEAS